MRSYEGLFLVDDGKATDNFQAVADQVKGLLERNGATVQKLEKMESRRLAYEVKKNKRGTYIVTLFEADPANLRALKRDCQISAFILRVMFVRAELVGVPLIETEEFARPARPEAAGAETPDAEAIPDVLEVPDDLAPDAGTET